MEIAQNYEYNVFDNFSSVMSRAFELVNKVHENRWGDEGTPLVPPQEEDEDDRDPYIEHFREFLKTFPISIEGPREVVHEFDTTAKQITAAFASYRRQDNDNNKENKNIKKDDGKEYINPFVPVKEQLKRDKTVYIEEHGDYIFEYDWNIISYDNYNTPDQDPWTYDYQFNLNDYIGVRGVYIDLGDEAEYVAKSKEEDDFHSSFELVETKFLPKAYRYAHGIAYTEVESRLLMAYDTQLLMVQSMAGYRKPYVKDIIEESPAIAYIQSHLDKYYAYLRFCKAYGIEPEWRDVHRHYGVWFRENILTYQIWEEYYETEECFKDVVLETILSGTYFEDKRAEVEDIQSRLTESDKIVRAQYRHRDIYPDDDEYYLRYIDEDDAYVPVIGYDPSEGVVLKHEFYLEDILEATTEYAIQNDIPQMAMDYNAICDYILNTLEEEEQALEETLEEFEREYEESIPEIKFEERLEQYRENERKRYLKKNNYGEETNILKKAMHLVRAMDMGEMVAEVCVRPLLKPVYDKLYRPSITEDTITFGDMYKSLSDFKTFQDMLNWRRGKFSNRAKEIMDSLHKAMAETFYVEMTENSLLNPNLSEEKRRAIDELYDSLDDDELPPIEVDQGALELDMSRIFEGVAEIYRDEINETYGINDGMERISKQYTDDEKDALGYDPSDESYIYDETAEQEGLRRYKEFKENKELEGENYLCI